MNEGIYYQITDNHDQFMRRLTEKRKARILHLITKSGFVSHMELVALHNNQKDTSEEDLSVTKSALIELQRSGELPFEAGGENATSHCETISPFIRVKLTRYLRPITTLVAGALSE